MRISSTFSWKNVIVFLLLVITSNTYSYATGVKTIERGTGSTISWSVGGSATQCTGSTNYPNSDSLFSSWNGTTRTSAGSAALPAAMTAGSYTFTCTDPVSLTSDSATLVVEDCGGSLSPGRTSWNGSSCVAPSGSVPAVSVTWTNPVIVNGDWSTFSYSATGNPSSCTGALTGWTSWSGTFPSNPFSNNLGPFGGNVTATVTCTNGSGSASASANLTVCAPGDTVSGGACVSTPPPSANCPNGYFNVNGEGVMSAGRYVCFANSCPSGNAFTGNGTYNGNPVAYYGCASDVVCGSFNGATPLANDPYFDPYAQNPGYLCNNFTETSQSPGNTSSLWRWSCFNFNSGNTAQCSAPKYGCTDPYNTNYNPTGANNKFGCSNTCTSGRTWDVPSQSCVVVSAGGTCTGTGTWGSCTYSVNGLAEGAQVSAANNASGYTGNAVLRCDTASTNAMSFVGTPTCTALTGQDCAATTVTWGSCTGAIPATANGSTNIAQDTNSYSTVGAYVGAKGYSCSNGVFTAAAGGACNQVTCTVATDSHYPFYGSCSGACANGSPTYPSCPTPLVADLVASGGVWGTPTDAGGNATLGLIASNNGGISTGAAFNNILQIQKRKISDGSVLTDTIGLVVNTPALDTMDARLINFPYTFTRPAITNEYHVRICLDHLASSFDAGTITELNEGNNCSPWALIIFPPVVHTNSLSADPSTCTIPTGASSCSTDITWDTVGAVGVTEITSNNPNISNPVYTGNTGGPSATPVIGIGATTFYLYNSAVELANTTVTASCATPGASWDTLNKKCVYPQVGAATVINDYYPPGSLDFTCIGSTDYTIIDTTHGTVPVSTTTYSGAVSWPTSTEAQYIIRCISGNVTDSKPLYYHATPGTTIINIIATPKTIAPTEKITLSWDTKFPDNTCALTAKVVCANNACNVGQAAEQVRLSAILTATTTDSNDPFGPSRNLQSAVKTVAPGHTTTDFKALGRKTLSVKYTTDFTYDCGVRGKETKRVQVTRSEEQ